jgi:hypothetical protein
MLASREHSNSKSTSSNVAADSAGAHQASQLALLQLVLPSLLLQELCPASCRLARTKLLQGRTATLPLAIPLWWELHLASSRPSSASWSHTWTLVCCGTRWHHHLSARARPLHHAEDRADEAAVLLERVTHPSAPYARDGQPQAIPVSLAPQEPGPKHGRWFSPHHLVQPATPQHLGHSRQPAWGQLGYRSPLCGPHLQGRTPAGASECWSPPPPPRQHITSAGDRGPLPPGGGTQRWAGPSSHQLHGTLPHVQGPLLQLQGFPPRLQEPPPGQRIPLPRRHHTHPAGTICHYGAWAQKWTQPCFYSQKGKLTQQISLAAHVCATTTGCLFMTDRHSKRQFMVDTDSDLCVYPCRLIPWCRERSTTTSMQVMALPSTPVNGCLSASIRFDVVISHGGSWWPMPHIPSLACTSSLILASWWTSETTAYWTESHLPWPKQPVHRSQAWRSVTLAHWSTTLMPNSRPSLAQLESSVKCTTTLSITSGLYLAHKLPADHGDWHQAGSLSPKQSLVPCCEMAQLASQRVPGILLYSSCPRRTTVGVLVATTEH